MNRPTILCALVVSVAGLARSVPAQEIPVRVPEGRIVQLERWLKAVAKHAPGAPDEASDGVAALSNSELQGLWIDLTNLVALMRAPTHGTFTFTPHGSRASFRIDYTPLQLARLRAFACAAAGILQDDSYCIRVRAAESVGGELRALAERARVSWKAGDPNYVIKRGALLHTDIAMSGPLPTTPVDSVPSRPLLGPQSFLMHTADGQSLDLGQAAIHWEIGRMLLDDVRPKGATKPAPSSDGMVRLWYRSTAAWMQKGEHLNKVHLNHARQIFPHDADILFLLGCLHETFADPQVQSVLRSTVLPRDVVMDMEEEHAELRLAEDTLREALEVRPRDAEARLRFGRLVALRGRYAEAVSELRRALGLLPEDDNVHRYYGELFLGAALEGVGRYDESRAAYERAAALFPKAQSPFIGLSELARRTGDRRSALDAMRKVFELPSFEEDRVDPWWGYHVFQARNADQLLEELWTPFRKTEAQR